MSGPLEGVKVVELGIWVAAPVAASVLADWGADVIKVEPPGGDPLRAAAGAVLRADAPLDPGFVTDNRGKRGVVLDLRTEQGLETMMELIAHADVFVTNVRAAGLRRLGLDPESLRSRFPRLVYASISGYGLEGPKADTGGFDLGVYWASSGIADLLTAPGSPPPIQRLGMGDHQTGMVAVSMICAALVHRARTGEGQLVSTSLLRSAAFTIAADLNMKLLLDDDPVHPDRRTMWNPLWNNYATSDGRRLWLINPYSDPAWPVLARLVGRTDWLEDPELATQQLRTPRCTELVAELDRIFASRTYAEWAALLDSDPKILWAPVNTVDDVLADPQTRAAGAIVEVEEHVGIVDEVASPVDFHGSVPARVPGAPLLGEHTDAVLAALEQEPSAWPSRHLVTT